MNILKPVDRLAEHAGNVTEAIKHIQILLAREIGGALLLLEEPNQTASVWSSAPVTDFLTSTAWPFRAFYVETLTWRGRKLGRLIACFGSWSSNAEELREVAHHVAQCLARAIVRLPGSARHPEAA